MERGARERFVSVGAVVSLWSPHAEAPSVFCTTHLSSCLHQNVPLPLSPILSSVSSLAPRAPPCSEYVMVDSASRTVTPLFSAGDGARASLVKASASDVLLLRNGSGIFLGPEGRTTRRGAQVPWAGEPSSVSISRPYAVARISTGFEVRPLEPLSAAPLVQRLDFDASIDLICAHSTRDGSLPLMLRGADEVARLAILEPLPFEEQAGRLLGEGEYEEALAVAGLVPADGPDVSSLKDRIHAAYGRALFGRGEFNDALLHFSMDRRSDPLQLLLLLPSLSPAGLLEKSLARAGESLPSGSEPSGDDFSVAVATMLPYLLSARSRVASAAAGEQDPEAAFRPSTAGPLAVLLDMAILKSLLIMPDSGALLQFIERPNCIDFELGTRALREAGRYSELVALCQVRMSVLFLALQTAREGARTRIVPETGHVESLGSCAFNTCLSLLFSPPLLFFARRVEDATVRRSTCSSPSRRTQSRWKCHRRARQQTSKATPARGLPSSTLQSSGRPMLV